LLRCWIAESRIYWRLWTINWMAIVSAIPEPLAIDPLGFTANFEVSIALYVDQVPIRTFAAERFLSYVV